ncbi:MAG: DUF2490 domain-containing protein [Vulcanimicrobiota bacterium]
MKTFFIFSGKIIWLLGLFILIIRPWACFANEDNHWEFWHEEEAGVSLSPQLKTKAHTEFRHRKGTLFYKHTDLSFNYFNRGNFKYGLGYRNVLNLDDGIWKKEDRIYATVIPFVKINNLTVEDKNEIEFRFFPGEPREYRYRNMIKFSHPLFVNKHKINLYTADEIFIDLNGRHKGEISRNRLYFGMNSNLSRNINLDLHYIRQSNEKKHDEGEIWHDTNVFGVELNLSF